MTRILMSIAVAFAPAAAMGRPYQANQKGLERAKEAEDDYLRMKNTSVFYNNTYRPEEAGGKRAAGQKDTRKGEYAAPGQGTAIEMVRLAADTLSDTQVLEDRVGGLEGYERQLSKAMARDVYYWNVGMNIRGAYEELNQYLYVPMRRSVLSMAQVRDNVDRAIPYLMWVVEGNRQSAEEIRYVTKQLAEAVEAMDSAPPAASKEAVDHYLLEDRVNNVTAGELAKLDQIDEMIEDAYDLTMEGQLASGLGKLNEKIASHRGKVAAGFDKTGHKKTTENRASGNAARASGNTGSQGIIKKAGMALKMAVKRVEAAHEKVLEQVDTDDGLLSFAAKEARRCSLMSRKSATRVVESGDKINEVSRRIGELRTRYEYAKARYDTSRMEEIKEEARAEIAKAEYEIEEVEDAAAAAEMTNRDARAALAAALALQDEIRSREIGEDSYNRLIAKLPPLQNGNAAVVRPSGPKQRREIAGEKQSGPIQEPTSLQLSLKSGAFGFD